MEIGIDRYNINKITFQNGFFIIMLDTQSSYYRHFRWFFYISIISYENYWNGLDSNDFLTLYEFVLKTKIIIN